MTLTKQLLKNLISIASLAEKYSYDALDLYKCSDGKWRGIIEQIPGNETITIRYFTFFIEVDDFFKEDIGSINHIYFPKTLTTYMVETKMKDFDNSMVETFLLLNHVENPDELFKPYMNIVYNDIELDRGAYIEYTCADFELNVEPTAFLNVTYRTPKISVGFVRQTDYKKEVAIAVQETEYAKSIGTIMVL